MPAAELKPEQQIFSVVILGNFNPAIFHPLWYAQNELIPEQEISDATEVLTSDEVSTFQVNEVHFQIERHRFGLTSKDASKAPYLRDLAVGSFSLLEHTPLTALGLNLDSRFALPSLEAWHAVGNRLAPKQCWQGILESPGMLGVSMLGTRANCQADRVSVRVAPANGLDNGVFVGINQHYNIETERRQAISERNNEMLRILGEDWNSFRSYAENTALALVTDTEVDAGGTS